ncbi:SirB2 family protein [Psychrobacter sp. FDAARGOS_221]|uniref:SirB2 family protein n=1 Tax=Psychrobacter sp. FDAARGOS_221 TaxID=1975705 RepID=UPI000BB53385|nr:SirB2 family protein [Psychrobacter sp. FDAARGOS_221]PNK60530.1 hypothetical protein A6J60_006345 [Psychrobacter sp. FDAARGOS_221]
MKHFHLLMVLITLILFVWQAYLALSGTAGFSKKLKIATHIVYTFLIVSGALTVMPLLSTNAPLQWVMAKIILLLAAISASIKAFRATATPAQVKAGVFIAAIAYFGILVLAVVKPANFI